MKNKFLIIAATVVVLGGAAVYLVVFKYNAIFAPKAASFKECVALGYPVLESYPRQCQAPFKKAFVEDIGNELEKKEVIIVEIPRPNQPIDSPLAIKGQTRGSWFFEASFPIHLYDGAGKEIASAAAQAKGDWMTNDFISFEATLDFAPPETEEGTLIFQKDNPSGRAELADELRVPVKFSKTAQKF